MLVALLFWAATTSQVPALIGAPGGRALACLPPGAATVIVPRWWSSTSVGIIFGTPPSLLAASTNLQRARLWAAMRFTKFYNLGQTTIHHLEPRDSLMLRVVRRIKRRLY